MEPIAKASSERASIAAPASGVRNQHAGGLSAYLNLRARLTNDPSYLARGRSVGRHAQNRRRRDLVAIYIDALGGPSLVSTLMLTSVRKAAELVTASEMLRAAMLNGEAVDLNNLIKLEGEARRAVRALGLKQHRAPDQIAVGDDPLREKMRAQYLKREAEKVLA